MRAFRMSCAGLLAAALLLGAGTGLAEDEVGIFFDRDAEKTCINAAALSQVTSYLILLEPSASGAVWGWGCRLDCENGSILGTEIAGNGAINVGQSPEYVVGLASPLPVSDVVELLTINVLVDSTDPVGFYLSPYEGSDSDYPIYAADDAANLLPMTPRVIGSGDLVAGINYPNCLPEQSTWGQVKLIYH